MFRFPAGVAGELYDVPDHAGVEYAGALGDEHLAVRVFVELDPDFSAPVGAAFGPAVLEVVEADDFAAFEWECHGFEFYVLDFQCQVWL